MKLRNRGGGGGGGRDLEVELCFVRIVMDFYSMPADDTIKVKHVDDGEKG